MALREPAQSKAYYRTGPVVALEDGSRVDPTSDAVKFAFIPEATNITSANTWAQLIAISGVKSGTGEWETDSTVTPARYYARILWSGTGGGGTVELAKATYLVRCQITDSPEAPVKVCDSLKVV